MPKGHCGGCLYTGVVAKEGLRGAPGEPLSANVGFLRPPVMICHGYWPYPRERPQAESELPPAPLPAPPSGGWRSALVETTAERHSEERPAPPARRWGVRAGSGYAWTSLVAKEGLRGARGEPLSANVGFLRPPVMIYH